MNNYKAKEYHLCLDDEACKLFEKRLATNYRDTHLDLLSRTVVYSTQIEFLDFDVCENLFVHYHGRIHQIHLGDGDLSGCKQQIRKENNLGKMLLAGTFEWFDRGQMHREILDYD